MKKQSIVVLAALFVVGAMISGCKLIGDLEYTVDPDPVEMHGDSVAISITVKIPPKGLHKKASAEVTPKLGNRTFKSHSIQGEKATGNGQTIPFKAGGTVNYTDVIPYDGSMEKADLLVSGTATKGKKSIDIPEEKIADGTDVTPFWVQNDDKALIGVDAFVRSTEEVYSAQINYLKGKYDVRSTEMKQQDIKDLTLWLTDAMTNPKVAPKSVNLVAYASPEGETAKNGELANDRAKSGSEAFTKIMASAGYTGTIVPNLQGKGEDWAGFKIALEKSDLEDKALIIRILEMHSSPQKREEEIRKLAATYRKLEADILPSLRRCQLNVVYDKIGWSDAELKDLSKSKPDTLTAEELLFTAALYDDLSEKMRVYNLVVTQYPQDWRGPNNVGYVYYMQNDLANAQSNFEKASALDENPVVLNNMGIITRINGDRDKAREILNSAVSAGSEVKYNIGIIDIQDGRYDSAIGNMGGAPTFNKALAQCLNKDYGASLLTLDGSDDKESAIGYYLKAINGAKQNNLDMMTSNLKSAISKDPSLKAKAAEDRVFVKFFENASFKAVVQ
ncbi:hypothetical protein JYT72_00185 [Crocinitomix catalasitica]|nr:hypothetical protein [Crocinitomix catalasitica]